MVLYRLTGLVWIPESPTLNKVIDTSFIKFHIFIFFTNIRLFNITTMRVITQFDTDWINSKEMCQGENVSLLIEIQLLWSDNYKQAIHLVFVQDRRQEESVCLYVCVSYANIRLVMINSIISIAVFLFIYQLLLHL